MTDCKNIYVDGGATSTKIYLCDENKKILDKLVGPRLNLVAFETESLRNLNEIKKLIFDFRAFPIKFGIPGIRMYDKEKIKSFFVQDFLDIEFLTDIELQAELLVSEKEFNFMSLGTGSVNLEKTLKSSRIIGGWGHLFGDYGSAFDFGKTWIRHGINDFENKKPDSNFIKSTCEYFKIKDFEEIKKMYLDQDNFKQKISEFTVNILTIIPNMILEKKIVSEEIIKKLVTDLKNSNFNTNLTLYVSGGLLSSKEYRSVFLEQFYKFTNNLIVL
ncbi:hypothetical protein SSABA_v1c08890 [Spiroplasma sabaudiense Ar-1343]|uniref:N-acetylglucosamine kinase n=1 Tax=Spiroplasma sabaudiense Ar-1343 TaxID=1276257 RepID=W6AAU9_9MOLU|nr:hypothetical protein [Spiroplasma sabaudiense]AHI54288.1 hypothetical protein SSABA_v1c08890 [Spiroplasma sabaudiense Ar-1343]